MQINKILIIIFLLCISFVIHSNEKTYVRNETQFSFQTPVLLSPNIPINATKSIKMKRIGIAGIVLLVTGALAEFGGGFMFVFFYTRTLSYPAMIASGINIPASWYNLPWIGFGIAMVGTVFFIAGLVMTIVGFAYYRKLRKKKVSMFYEMGDAEYTSGISFKI